MAARKTKMFEFSSAECKKIMEEALKDQDFKYISHQLVPSSPNGYHGLYYTAVIQYIQQVSETEEFKQISCFIKSVPRNDHHISFIDRLNLLVKENEMYTTILPRMRHVITYKLPVARCFLLRYSPLTPLENILVLEDLSALGYRVKEAEVMDWTQCSLSLQAVARLHAGSLVLEQKGQRVLELCRYHQESLFVSDASHPCSSFLRASIDTVLDVCKEHPKFHKRLVTDERKSKLVEAYADAVHLVQPSPVYDNVICHGDLWACNLMIKYNIENCPIDVSLIDLQLYRYASPITDVLMLIYLNTTRDFRDHHTEALLSVYHEALRAAVEGSGCYLPTSLNLEALRSLAKEYHTFALVAASAYVPMTSVPPESREVERLEDGAPGSQDFDVLKEFLNSRGEMVMKGMQMKAQCRQRVEECIDELLTHLGL